MVLCVRKGKMILARLHGGPSKFRNPTETKGFSRFQNVQTGCEAPQSLLFMWYQGYFLVVKEQSLTLNTHSIQE